MPIRLTFSKLEHTLVGGKSTPTQEQLQRRLKDIESNLELLELDEAVKARMWREKHVFENSLLSRRKKLITVAHSWREESVEFISNEQLQQGRRQRLAAEYHDQFDRLMKNFNACDPFHHFETHHLLKIIDEDLPFIEKYTIEGKKLKQALVATLILRLEASFAMNDSRYDDHICYVASQLHSWDLVIPRPNFEEEDNNLKRKVKRKTRLLPFYQRRGWSQTTYNKALQFIHANADKDEKNRLQRLPLYNEHAPEPLLTRNKLINGINTPVPFCLHEYIISVDYLPKFIFRGIHKRLSIMQKHSVLIAELKIPLPQLDLVEFETAELEKLEYHPILVSLDNRRQYLEKAIQEVSQTLSTLSWYQGKTKKFFRNYKHMLESNLYDCRQKELTFISKARFEAYPHVKSLTVKNVSEVKVILDKMHGAFDAYENHTENEKHNALLQEIKNENATLERKLSQVYGKIADSEEDSLHIKFKDELICEMLISEIAKGLQDHFTEKDVEGTIEIQAFISALAKNIPIKLSTTLASLACYYHLKQPVNEEPSEFNQNILDLMNQLEKLQELRKHHGKSIEELKQACSESSITHFVLHENLAAIEKWHQTDVTVTTDEKIKLLNELSNYIQAGKDKCKSKLEEIEEYEKTIEENDYSELPGRIEQLWDELSELLLNPDYACVIAQLENEHAKLLGRKPISFEAMKAFILDFHSKLSDLVNQQNKTLNSFATIYRTLNPIVMEIKQSMEPSSSEFKSCDELHQTIGYLARERIPAITMPIPRVSATVSRFKVEAFRPEVELGKVYIPKISYPQPASILEQDFEKCVAQSMEHLPKLLETIGHIHTAEQANDESTEKLVNQLIQLGKNVRYCAKHDQVRQKELDKLMEKLLWNYCRKWRNENINFSDQHAVSAIQEKIMLALYQGELFNLEKIFKQRARLSDDVPEIKAWRRKCRIILGKLIDTGSRELLADVNINISHYRELIFNTSQYPNELVLKNLCERMIIKKVFTLPNESFELSKEEMKLLSENNKSLRNGYGMFANKHISPTLVNAVSNLAILTKAKIRLSHVDTRLTIKRLDRIESTCLPLFVHRLNPNKSEPNYSTSQERSAYKYGLIY